MKLAYMMGQTRGDIDLCLTRIATEQMARGLRVAGLVQRNSDRADAGACDMDVRILPSGPEIRISQTLGAGSRGCRLNPEALEQAVSEVDARLSAQTELLIVNKFGKHESEGRGFRETIARALAMDVPVLAGVNRLNLDMFLEFSGGAAEKLTRHDDLAAWLARDEGLRGPALRS